MSARILLVILAIFSSTSAYTDLFGTSLTRPLENRFDLYMFQHFGTIKDPRFSKFRYGFPAGIYGSSIIPITIWFYHWDITEDGKRKPYLIILFIFVFAVRVLNFGTMIPMSINWLTIVSSCDEIRFPRCSWAHFVNFVQPLQFDYELLEQSGASPGISQEYMIPYIGDGCWPIKSIEQASIIYIYAACIAYWKTPGFDRQVNRKFSLSYQMPPLVQFH